MKSWQLGFQGSVSPIMEGIIDVHNHIFFFLILIFVFVFWMFSETFFQFYWKEFQVRNSAIYFRQFSHNAILEVVWTVLPSFILIGIAVPSFALLYAMDEVIDPSITIKAVGHQWYWSYQYSDCLSDLTADYIGDSFHFATSNWASAVGVFDENTLLYNCSNRSFCPDILTKDFIAGTKNRAVGNIFYSDVKLPLRLIMIATSRILDIMEVPAYVNKFQILDPSAYPTVKFDSYMLSEEELKVGDYRLLEVDEPVVLPLFTPVRLLVTSEDVIHSFAVPQLGVKVDAVPGRLNQQPFVIERDGTYYGQCSELCGVNHGFMPIVIKAIPFKDFFRWYIFKTGAELSPFVNSGKNSSPILKAIGQNVRLHSATEDPFYHLQPAKGRSRISLQSFAIPLDDRPLNLTRFMDFSNIRIIDEFITAVSPLQNRMEDYEELLTSEVNLDCTMEDSSHNTFMWYLSPLKNSENRE